MSGRSDGMPFDPRRGMILPLALLMIFALTAVALSTAALAHTELLLERGALDYLDGRIREEAALDASGTATGSGGSLLRQRTLAGGFVLTEAGGERASSVAVRWRAHADSLTRLLPGAAEVGDGTGLGVVAGGVEASSQCVSPVGLPLVRVRESPGGPPPDPPLQDPPRVGPLSLEALLELPAIEIASGERLGDSATRLFIAESGTRIEAGEASGVLLSPGSVIMEGTAFLSGLAVVRGDLRLRESARLEGVVLAGGAISVEDDARLMGCPSTAAMSLMDVLPEGLGRVPGEGYLGRF